MWPFVDNVWSLVFFTFVRPMYKWFYRALTGRCELLRITYDEHQGAARTHRTESSLKHSKQQALKRLLTSDNINIDQAVDDIISIKSVSPEVHPQFAPALTICLQQICGYRQLISEVEALRKIPYSSENPEHERLLMQLWDNLKPDEKLESRISKQWTDIGFQGDDPMTDFRGMGILGLHNLVFFVTQHTSVAKQLVSRAAHPQYGYSFAIVGINITGMAYSLLLAGHFKTHFYNVVQGKPSVVHFHHVYSHLLYEFDKFWFDEKPRDIMEFNRVKEKFQKRIIHQLKDKKTTLSGSFATQ